MTSRARIVSVYLVAAGMVSAFTAGLPAVGQSAAPAPTQQAWQFEISPYLWGAGLDGNIKVGRLPAAGVEATFSDLWDVLDLGLMAAFEARHDRWGFMVNSLYVSLSETQPAPDPAFGNTTAEFVQQMYNFGASYMAVPGKTSVNVVFGARYQSLDSDLELSGGTASGRSVSGDESWWDGFVGGRVVFRPSEHWMLTGYADVGAGGSELSWQVVAGGGYVFEKVVTIKFGYRYLNTDYENGAFVYDMTMSGPYLGAGFRF